MYVATCKHSKQTEEKGGKAAAAGGRQQTTKIQETENENGRELRVRGQKGEEDGGTVGQKK